MDAIFDRKRLAPLKDTVGIVGVGETGYGADYRHKRAMAKGEALRLVYAGLARIEARARRCGAQKG